MTSLSNSAFWSQHDYIQSLLESITHAGELMQNRSSYIVKCMRCEKGELGGYINPRCRAVVMEVRRHYIHCIYLLLQPLKCYLCGALYTC